MGMFRKAMSVSTAGTIKYRSNSERKAVGTLKQGQAAMKEAKAAERLTKAQIDALKAETRGAAARPAAARSEAPTAGFVPRSANESHVHEYELGDLFVLGGKRVYMAACRCGDEQRVLAPHA